MEGKFFLFAWIWYEAGGGLRDYQGTFNTVGEAKAAFDQLRDDEWWDEGEIATFHNGHFVKIASWTHGDEFWKDHPEPIEVKYGWQNL